MRYSVEEGRLLLVVVVPHLMTSLIVSIAGTLKASELRWTVGVQESSSLYFCFFTLFNEF